MSHNHLNPQYQLLLLAACLQTGLSLRPHRLSRCTCLVLDPRHDIHDLLPRHLMRPAKAHQENGFRWLKNNCANHYTINTFRKLHNLCCQVGSLNTSVRHVCNELNLMCLQAQNTVVCRPEKVSPGKLRISTAQWSSDAPSQSLAVDK